MNVIKSLITLSIQRPAYINQHLKKLQVSTDQYYKLTFCRPVSTAKDDFSGDYSLVTNEVGSISERPPLPIITKRDLPHHTGFTKPRQAWLENLDILDLVHLGTVDLHPLIFACSPRLDILHLNVEWQRAYHRMSYKRTPTRGEMVGGSRKPWPQKGTGRARHGSTNSPLWYKGAKAHGPRGPKTWYFMPSIFIRIKGLTTALSMKLAQDDLHIIDSLEIPTDDSKYLENLAEHRGWGPSVLFVDAFDVAPRNFAVAVSNVPHINIMPVYGLNVFSMLKHDTLVLTLAALEQIEERLLFQLFRRDIHNIGKSKVCISP